MGVGNNLLSSSPPPNLFCTSPLNLSMDVSTPPPLSLVAGVVVPKSHVRAVKSRLAAHSNFGRSITRVECSSNEPSSPSSSSLFLVLTNLKISSTTTDGLTAEGEEDILRDLGLGEIPGLSITKCEPVGGKREEQQRGRTNPLVTAISSFFSQNPTPDSKTLLRECPRRFSLYSPLLLLPAGSFASPLWESYLASLPSVTLSAFYAHLATSLCATHLAVNAPIPSSSALRSPTGLTPLYGSFEDLWVSTVQSGIYQTWAPAHTMFSRGNVKEKARVLGFGDVAGERVVDMYAGIGYFAFSYAAAGASRVFCWELNEWSCEALVRGARFNGWSVAVVKGGERWVDGGERIVVFLEDNNFAGERLHGMRGVRHVNAGLLPTSRGGWGTALEIIDGELGGWIHVHENMGISEIKVKTEEVVAALDRKSVV